VDLTRRIRTAAAECIHERVEERIVEGGAGRMVIEIADGELFDVWLEYEHDVPSVVIDCLSDSIYLIEWEELGLEDGELGYPFYVGGR
jgi:hypothetical protein